MGSSSIFVERLNRLLDHAEFPQNMQERAMAFGKMFGLKPIVSQSILSGSLAPKPEVLEAIAEEFEVKMDWLLGKDKK